MPGWPKRPQVYTPVAGSEQSDQVDQEKDGKGPAADAMNQAANGAAIGQDMERPAPDAVRELVHQAGKLFGLITTSAFAPILDDILDTGVDVLMGLDPEEGKGTDLADTQRRFQARKRAIWGGVSGAMTVEQGTEEDTEQAVIRALRVLGKDGRFILSPVDNVRVNTPKAWTNTRKFIATWKKHRKEFS